MIDSKKDPVERVLNDEQRQAVEHRSGPLLVIAGAGTGKTTVVTERIKYLITSNLAKPSEILALTFTEKAAREMEERVDQIVPYGYTQMHIGTFHSFCEQVLKDEAIHIGLNPGFKLLTDADSTLLMRQNLFSFHLEYFRPLGNPTKFIAGMLQHFSRLKDEDISPEQYLRFVQEKSKIPHPKSQKSEEEDLEIKKYQELARVYQHYEELKIKEGVMDFSDLISHTLTLFRTRKNILKQYLDRFPFILVDEFQDTNVAQNELVLLLTGAKHNITAVCDDDQSIYKFRGAAVSNVIQFRTNFPKSKIIVLTHNYRSTQTILDSAYRMIQNNNPDRLEVKEGIDKHLQAVRKQEGVNPHFLFANRVENEADDVVKEIKKLVKDRKNSYEWKDVAILVRANNHSESFVRACIRTGVPFQFLGPGQLFRQDEIKDLIAYLSVLNDVTDTASLVRVFSIDFFNLSPRDITILLQSAKKQLITLFELCEVLCSLTLEPYTVPAISTETRETITMLMKMIHRHLQLVTKETAGQLLYYFLNDTGMLKHILEYKAPIDENKATNIMRFFNKLKNYESEHADATVGTVLDWIMLSLELGESPAITDTDWTENNAVNILTIHSAKGLEFPIVFLVNLVSQRFPTTERREQIPIPDELLKEVLPEGDFHLEEERRLFYVGMTRARDQLYVTAAAFYGEGKRAKKLSPFITEALGEEAIKKAQHVEIKPDQLSLLDWGTSAPLSVNNQDKTGHRITYLSYSQIDAFRLCPLHYKLRYILKVPTPASPALSFGSSIHSALREFYELARQKKPVSKEILINLLSKNWLREGYTSKAYEKEMIKRGENYLEAYFEKEFVPQGKTILLEENFTLPIKNTDRYMRIGGKIDRIDELPDGKIEIIDYKTGRVPTRREVDTNLQLSLYAMAATEIPDAPFGRKPEDIILSLYYFDTQEKMSTTRTSTQLLAEKDTILSIADEIEHSDFTCSGNQLCGNCEYKLFCGVE